MSKETILPLLLSSFMALVVGYLLIQTRFKRKKELQDRALEIDNKQKQKQRELTPEEKEIYEWCKEQGASEYLAVWTSTGFNIYSENKPSEERNCSKEILESLAQKEWINISRNNEGRIYKLSCQV